MRSPFPGMDPYLEGEEWEDFHTSFLAAVRAAIAPQLTDDYAARVERRVYIEQPPEEATPSFRQPDVTILYQDRVTPGSAAATASATTATPALLRIPEPVERREAYLVLRHLPDAEVVTVVELLSPANKRRGGEGFNAYREKRSAILRSPTHLVEIDLLLHGTPPPLEPEIPGDYRITVSRSQRRPGVEVYSWPVLQPMPVVPIPLRHGDDDIRLNVQAVFAQVYDQADYQKTVRYEGIERYGLGGGG